MTGDFTYNGIPIFNIDLNDFCNISSAFYSGKNLSIKTINDQVLADKIRKADGHALNFGVCFEGIILDLRELR